MNVRPLIASLLLLVAACPLDAGEPVRPLRSTIVTNHFAIEGLRAACCAMMLKHALTNVSGVVSADIFLTNKITRVVYRPGKNTLRQIRKAFRSEIVIVKRLKKIPKGELR